eukprot:SAG31_NODE_1997_length_6694_cov_12.857056_2_plen_141_part_00
MAQRCFNAALQLQPLNKLLARSLAKASAGVVANSNATTVEIKAEADEQPVDELAQLPSADRLGSASDGSGSAAMQPRGNIIGRLSSSSSGSSGKKSFSSADLLQKFGVTNNESMEVARSVVLGKGLLSRFCANYSRNTGL